LTWSGSLPTAVVVHSLAEARAALAGGEAVTLLSPPGAAVYAGCGWWRALIEAARAEFPDTDCVDILDCADGTGQALAALRIGVNRLVLGLDAPGRDAVVAIAEARGGFVLSEAPQVNARLTNSRVNPNARFNHGAAR